jgi:hypothetical protein
LRLAAGSDVQPIVHYLHCIAAFLSSAAAHQREYRHVRRHAAIGAAAHLRMRLHRLPNPVIGAAARLCAHLDRVSHGLTPAAARLRSDLGRFWRRAADRRATARVERSAPASGLTPGRQWEIVIGLAERELARAPAIAALQTRAALKIDAAEHALGRIIADCAKVLAAPAVPAPQPGRQLPPRPEAPARDPLAA